MREEEEEEHGEQKGGLALQGKSSLKVQGVFFIFPYHGSFIRTKSASAGTFSGNCRVQQNDTNTFSTSCPDLQSFSSFFTLRFPVAAEPTVTVFIVHSNLAYILNVMFINTVYLFRQHDTVVRPARSHGSNERKYSQ